MRILIIALPLLFLFACNLVEKDDNQLTVDGLRPIYGDGEELFKIAIQDTQKMENPGKIVYLAPRLFVNEVNKGIHVINNQDPLNPVKESFISIPFNKDLAVKNNIIYADNDTDLIAIKYYSFDSVQVLSRQKNVFDRLPAFPENYHGYFECVDETKGVVVGWEEAELINPTCRTF